MKRLAFAAAASLALAGGAAPAAGDELATRVLVVPLEVDPSAEGVDADALTTALERAAEEAGAVVSRADASLADTALIVGCDASDPRCLDEVAAALNVDRLLFGSVAAEDDGIALTLSLTSREGVPSKRRFALTGDTDEMIAALERDVPAFVVEAAEKRPQPAPEPEPPPEVAPEPTPPPLPPPRGGAARVPGYAWALVGGGVAIAAAGGGIALWGRGLQDDIDDAPTNTADDLDALRDLEGDARRRTRAGTALMATGLIAAGAGAVFAVLGSRERPADRPGDVAVAPALVRGGAGVSVTIIGF